MKKRVLIVEDESLAVVKLMSLLPAIDPAIEVMAITTSVKTTVEWLQQNPMPDLLLMDIELSDGKSFEIFNKVQIDSPAIFITAHDEFALQAFKANGIEYLLKPVLREDLAAAIGKLNQFSRKINSNNSFIDYERLAHELAEKMQAKQFRNRFLIKHANRMLSVDEAKAAYFFSEGRLNYIRTWEGEKFIVDYTLDELVMMLEPSRYFRISRSFLVSFGSIRNIEEYPGMRLKIELEPATDKEAVVSREKVTSFKIWIGK